MDTIFKFNKNKMKYKYIKNIIDFNDWDEIDNDDNKYLNEIFNNLYVGDRLLVNFNIKYGGIPTGDYKWGVIKYKNEELICIEFDDNINGHDGNSGGCKGKNGHCWYFYKGLKLEIFDLLIIKIIKK